MTSHPQVLDFVITKNFKDHLWLLYNDWFLKKNHALTPDGKLKKPSVTILREWILTARGKISSKAYVAGVKKVASLMPYMPLEKTFCRNMLKMETMRVIVKKITTRRKLSITILEDTDSKQKSQLPANAINRFLLYLTALFQDYTA